MKSKSPSLNLNIGVANELLMVTFEFELRFGRFRFLTKIVVSQRVFDMLIQRACGQIFLDNLQFLFMPMINFVTLNLTLRFKRMTRAKPFMRILLKNQLQV